MTQAGSSMHRGRPGCHGFSTSASSRQGKRDPLAMRLILRRARAEAGGNGVDGAVHNPILGHCRMVRVAFR